MKKGQKEEGVSKRNGLHTVFLELTGPNRVNISTYASKHQQEACSGECRATCIDVSREGSRK